MVERQEFTRKIELAGKGKIKIVSRGVTEIVIGETAAPRKTIDKGNPEKRDKSPKYPEGTIESLRPLLRGVFGSDNSEAADGYWMGVDKMATMTQEQAANKLKRAGIGHEAAARMLMMSDSLVNRGLANNNFTQKEVDAKISEVANILLPFFRNRPQR